MSDPKEIKLSIFKPLDEYFQILCLECPSGDFASGCSKDLMRLLTNECDSAVSDKPNEFSTNFLEALEQFAFNLKTADQPLSKVTIKGTLFKDLLDVFRKYADDLDPNNKTKKLENLTIGELPGYNVIEFAKRMNERVKNDNECTKVGFKMEDKISNDSIIKETYLTLLQSSFDLSAHSSSENLLTRVKQLFNSWLEVSFDNIYSSSTNYFNNTFLNEIYDSTFPNCYINPCHKRLMETYFEVINGSDAVAWSSFWGNAGPGNWGKLKENESKKAKYVNYRLNVIVVKHKGVKITPDTTGFPYPKTPKDKTETEFDENIAKIAFAFPEKIRNDFNRLIIKGHSTFMSKFGATSYSYAGTKCSTYKIPDIKSVLDFFSNSILSVSRGKKQSEPYIKDVEDKAPYNDSDVALTPYTIADLDSYIINYKDTWAADLRGRLWKRTKNPDGTYSKWEEYTNDKLEEDAKLFKEGADKTCGHLCIFSDPVKCNKFFEDMMKGSTYSMDELSTEINSSQFVRSYQALKDNIIQVNPVFVINTLRMFNFQKYTKLNDDGTKTIKIETFTRWWNRVGKELKLDAKGDYPTEPGSVFPGVHPQPDLTPPNPPANLELFFKLLISYINNNEYVLNPQSRELINRLPFTTIDGNLSEKQPEYFYFKDGTKIKNGAYKKDSDKASEESLGNLMEEMKKNSNPWNPVNMGLPENRSYLNYLLGLMVGVTPYGQMRISRDPSFSTGYGFLGGGGEPSDLPTILDMPYTKQLEQIKLMKPCTSSAVSTLIDGMRSLKNSGKELDRSNKYYADLIDNIGKLMDSENKTYGYLKLLSDYVKVINVLSDKTIDNKVVEDTMLKAITEYNSSSEKLSRYADSATRRLSDVFDRHDRPSSYYSSLGGR